MSKLKIKAQVMGLTGPVKGAKLKFYDFDGEIGGGNDLLLTGKTNSSGKIFKTSKEWRDFMYTWKWTPSGLKKVQVPNPADMPIFSVRVQAPDGIVFPQTPFAVLPGGAYTPIFIPWSKPQPLSPKIQVSLNGEPFYKAGTPGMGLDKTIPAVLKKLITGIQKGDDIELVFGADGLNEVKPILDLVKSKQTNLIAYITSVFPALSGLDLANMFPPPPPPFHGAFVVAPLVVPTVTPAMILAMAALVAALGPVILATGSSVLLVTIGVALIVAVASGYCKVGVTTGADANGSSSGSSSNATGLILQKAC